jgi:hypothetical protein
MKPVCVPCQRFFRCEKNGFYFIEGMPIAGVSHPAPGTSEPASWTPYKIWAGDLWRCEGCGTTILSGFGRAPVAEHYEPTFAERVQKLGADQLQVNDC